MTAVYTPAEDVTAALTDAGLKADVEYGPAPTEIEVRLDGCVLKLCRDLNREDGGWEGQVDLPDRDGYCVEDGPLPDASPAAVTAWVQSLIAGGLKPF